MTLNPFLFLDIANLANPYSINDWNDNPYKLSDSFSKSSVNFFSRFHIVITQCFSRTGKYFNVKISSRFFVEKCWTFIVQFYGSLKLKLDRPTLQEKILKSQKLEKSSQLSVKVSPIMNQNNFIFHNLLLVCL